MQFFQCAVWADQSTNAACTMVFADLIQTIGNIFQSGLPINFFPLTTLLDHGRAQSICTVQSFVRKAISVSNPALIDFFVFQRHHTKNFVIFNLDDQVGARRVVRCNRFAARQFPCAGAVAEWLAGQRTHGADVDHVS